MRCSLVGVRAGGSVRGRPPREIRVKLVEIGDAITGVEAREANARADYVCVVSNDSVSESEMVKIGATRPEHHVRELEDAQLP